MSEKLLRIKSWQLMRNNFPWSRGKVDMSIHIYYSDLHLNSILIVMFVDLSYSTQHKGCWPVHVSWMWSWTNPINTLHYCFPFSTFLHRHPTWKINDSCSNFTKEQHHRHDPLLWKTKYNEEKNCDNENTTPFISILSILSFEIETTWIVRHCFIFQQMSTMTSENASPPVHSWELELFIELLFEFITAQWCWIGFAPPWFSCSSHYLSCSDYFRSNTFHILSASAGLGICEEYS